MIVTHFIIVLAAITFLIVTMLLPRCIKNVLGFFPDTQTAFPGVSRLLISIHSIAFINDIMMEYSRTRIICIQVVRSQLSSEGQATQLFPAAFTSKGAVSPIS